MIDWVLSENTRKNIKMDLLNMHSRLGIDEHTRMDGKCGKYFQYKI